jgi:hypothetical protein
MKLEMLIQFIIPLVFLAIWALTSLLNRETQPLPPRQRKIPGSDENPTSASSWGREFVDRTAATPERPTLSRPTPASTASGSPPQAAARRAQSGMSSRPAPARPLGPDDAIVVIDSEGRRVATITEPSARSNRQSNSSRRNNRGKGGSNASSLRESPAETKRSLTDSVNRSLARERSQSQGLTPLSASFAPLSASPISSVQVGGVHGPTIAAAQGPALTDRDLQDMLRRPGKLREIALLGEILQPPVALRRRSS